MVGGTVYESRQDSSWGYRDEAGSEIALHGTIGEHGSEYGARLDYLICNVRPYACTPFRANCLAS